MTGRALPALAVAAGGARLAARAIERLAADGRRTGPSGWRTVNHRGRSVSLAAGPGLLAGALAGSVAGGADRRLLAAATAAGGLAAVAGRVDDLAGDAPRGLRGHLRALARGGATGGLAKLAGLPLAGASAVFLSAGPSAGPAAERAAGPALVDVGLVGTAAHVVNLLDVRPGRALKVVLPVALALGVGRGRGAPVALATAGSAGGLLGGDLGERWMLGDLGANLAGALLGTAAAVSVRPTGRRRALAALIGAALAGEFVGLSRIIDAVPPLARLDRLGRLAGADVLA